MTAVTAFLDGVLRGQGAVLDAKRDAPVRIPWPTDPVALTQADHNRRMAETLERVIEAGAVLMVNKPWRIARAVFGPEAGVGASMTWPYRGMSAGDVLAVCRKRLAGQIACGKAGHYAYDSNRVIALRQAERALVRMGGESD